MSPENESTTQPTPEAPLTTDKSFKMCPCGLEEPHGHFYKGDLPLEVPAVSKRGGHRLLELLLEREMITSEEKVFLEAQMEASVLPDFFGDDSDAEIRAVEQMFADEVAPDPMDEILSQLAGSGVRVIRI